MLINILRNTKNYLSIIKISYSNFRNLNEADLTDIQAIIDGPGVYNFQLLMH